MLHHLDVGAKGRRAPLTALNHAVTTRKSSTATKPRVKLVFIFAKFCVIIPLPSIPRSRLMPSDRKPFRRTLDKRAILRDHPIFGGLGPELIERLTSYGIRETVSR
jgi:hypothetical protein